MQELPMPLHNTQFAAARMAQIDFLIPRLEAEMKPLKNYSRSFSGRVGSGGQEAMKTQYDAYQADVARLKREYFELGGVEYSRHE